MSIGLLLVDDHTIVRQGLRVLLAAEPDFSVLGEAANGRDALDEARRLRPDVMVMDISMPLMNGVEATLAVRAALPATRVVILSMHGEAEHVCRALHAGATGYLLKESAGDELVVAVRAVHVGRRYLTPRISDDLISGYLEGRVVASPLDSLSPRERNVLQMVVEGYGNQEIALTLSLSDKTVETYRSRMMHKLGIDNLPALVKFAIEHGVTTLR